MSFAYKQAITIAHTQVPSTQSNFPVAVVGTYAGALGYANLKSVGNSGHVQNANGYDIYFYSDSALTTRIPAERVSYNAASGAVEFHVKVASLSSSVDTVIYMAYGDSGVSTDPNSDGTYGKTSVWDTNYKGVWHYADNAASTAVADSTGNTSATAFHNTSTIAATGKMDGGFSMVSGNSDNVGVTNPVALTSNNATISFWFNPPSTGVADWISYFGNAPTGDGGPTLGWVNQLGSLLQYSNGGGYTTVGTMTANNWYYIVTTGNSSANTAYLNASGVSAGSNNGGNNGSFYVGSGFGGYTTASFDEVRISNIIRSADWITTEYNNQNAPGSFYTNGSETAVGTSVNSNFLLFM